RYDARTLGNAIFGHPAPKMPLEKAEPVRDRGVPGFRWARTLAQKGLKGVAGLALKAADAVLRSVGAAGHLDAVSAAALGETKGIMEGIADSDLSEDSTVPEVYGLPVRPADERLPGEALGAARAPCGLDPCGRRCGRRLRDVLAPAARRDLQRLVQR